MPASHIGVLRWTSNLKKWEIGLEAYTAGVRQEGLRLSVVLHFGAQILAKDTYSVLSGEVHRQIALSDPGIDDFTE